MQQLIINVSNSADEVIICVCVRFLIMSVCVCLCMSSNRVLALFVGGACCYSDGVIATVDELVAPSILSGGSFGRSAGCSRNPQTTCSTAQAVWYQVCCLETARVQVCFYSLQKLQPASDVAKIFSRGDTATVTIATVSTVSHHFRWK